MNGSRAEFGHVLPPQVQGATGTLLTAWVHALCLAFTFSLCSGGIEGTLRAPLADEHVVPASTTPLTPTHCQRGLKLMHRPDRQLGTLRQVHQLPSGCLACITGPRAAPGLRQTWSEEPQPGPNPSPQTLNPKPWCGPAEVGNPVHPGELVIDGATLSHILGTPAEELLAACGARCGSVVICRSSPAQKAAIVRMMAEYEMRQVGPAS